MWEIIEPVTKYLFMLFALQSILPNRFNRAAETAGTFLYGVTVMVIINKITKLPSLMLYSYFIFLTLLLFTALLWAAVFTKDSLKLALPYICFYINFILCIRVFSESITNSNLLSMGIAVLFLAMTNLFFYKNRITELVYVTRTQYGVFLVSACALFVSYELWREFFSIEPNRMLWAAPCHYCMNLLMLYLVTTTVREYQEVIQLGVISKKREAELAEIDVHAGLVQQCYYIRHEFKNICFHMQVLLKEKKYEELDKLIAKYAGEKLEYHDVVNTGNRLVDALLSQKIREARMHGINIVTKVLLSEALPLSDEEVSTVLTNLIDNAMEASEKETDRDIRVEMTSAKGLLQVTVRNKVSYDVMEKNPDLRTTKREARFHGIGLSIIRDVVKRHNGKMEYGMNGDYFVVNLYL